VERVAHHGAEDTLPAVPVPRTFAPRVLRAAALLSAAAIFAGGCGADQEGGGGGGGGSGLPDDQQVRAVVARFGIATRAKDYQTICDQLLADSLVRTVESIGLPCESALQKGLADVRDPRLEISQVSIGSGRALVSVHSTAAGQPASDDAVQLVKQDGEWRIASLANPEGGATTATPAQTATATTPPATTPTQTATTATTPKASKTTTAKKP
jgi:hypothetical protein